MIHLAGVMPNGSGHDERLLARVIGQKKIVAGEGVFSGNQMRAAAVSVLGRIRSEVGKKGGRIRDSGSTELAEVLPDVASRLVRRSPSEPDKCECPTPGGEPLCHVAGSIRWQQAAPESGARFVEDPASQKVLQVGQRKFGATWVIQIQG
jgi:hypothetical protein